MVHNRAHFESKENRLARFRNGPPSGTIETLLNSIANFFNNEIALAPTPGHYQTSLLFLGIHAAALIIAEAFWNKTGLEGYKRYLTVFVDGDSEDTKFSNIASIIHDWRNVLAHQWLGSVGHEIGYDYGMSHGFENRNGVTFINPKIYCDYYLKAFSVGGKIWDYETLFNENEREMINKRIIKKYIER